MRYVIFSFCIGTVLSCQSQTASLHHGATRLESAVRPTAASGAPFNLSFGSAEVETFDDLSGMVRVHYTIDSSSAHQVPVADADSSGVPDYVELVGESVAWAYEEQVNGLGFRAPLSDAGAGDNGGDGRYDVYLLDFGAFNYGSDGMLGTDACYEGEGGIHQCITYILIENDFAEYGYPSIETAVKILASHEFFHAIQNAYDENQDETWSEGSAMWAEEEIYPEQTDFEGATYAYMSKTDRSLDEPLGLSFSYGTGIWSKFLSEYFESDVIRQIWESCQNGSHGYADPTYLEATDATLIQNYDSSLTKAFLDFGRWNLFTGSRADSSQSYAKGNHYGAATLHSTALSLPLLYDSWTQYLSTQYLRVNLNGVSSIDVMLQSEHVGKELTIYGAQGDGTLERLGTLVAQACEQVSLRLDVSGVYQVYGVLGDGRHGGGVSTTRVWIAPPDSEPTKPLGAPYTLRSCPEAPAEQESGEAEDKGSLLGCQGAAVPHLLGLLFFCLFLRLIHRKRYV